MLNSCANIPIVRKPVSNPISCDIHINTLELKSSVHSKSFGITHVIAVDTDLKSVKIIFKAYYIRPYGSTMEENFNVLPAYHFCKINSVEHLRLERSENEKCFMALMALRKVPTTSSLFLLYTITCC